MLLIEGIKKILSNADKTKKEGGKDLDPHNREVEEIKREIIQEMQSQGIDPGKNPDELRRRTNDALDSWLR